MKKVSIVIPCRNEEKYIETCIESLLTNGYPQELIEILVIDGESNDRTIEIVSHLQKKNQQIKLINNPKKLTPFALNLGVFNASNEYLLIASAHSSFEKNYIQTLIDNISTLENAVAVGGIMETKVKNSNPLSEAIKEVLTHPFGVGNSIFRIGTNKIKKVDTVPFGLYKTKELVDLKGYNELLIRNHDMELSKRILKKGGAIYLVPDAKCNYFARENYTALAKNNFNNGKWNILTVYITHTFSSLSLRHFIPLFFLLSISIPSIAAICYFPFIYLSFSAFCLYIMAMMYFSLKINNNKTNFLLILFAFLCLHLSYGMGSMYGFLKIPFTKR
mgnify:CR=1 FL=1